MAQQNLSPELEQKLNNLECPFKWLKGLTKTELDSSERDLHQKVKEKLDTSNDSDFLEYGFPSGICLIYEYIVARKPRDTIKEIIDVCEAKFNSVFENKRNHSLIRKAKIAYLHVLQGCKAFFELYFGNMQSLKDTLKDVPDNKTFNHDVQAYINGIKAAFLLTYGPYKTTEIGIQCAKRAVELDSTEGWYYFLVGKGLYRHRRTMNRIHTPTEEEIDFMEKAKQMEFKYEESVMFLIEMYSEMIEKGQNRETYFVNTVQLCRNIYERSTDWYCLWRCCRGLIRLDISDIDVDLVQKCLEKANTLSPNNPDILFTISKFYQKKKKLRNALHYANLAVEHGKGAAMLVSNALMLKHWIDHSEDLIPTIDEYINKAQTGLSKHLVMCLKARFLICERRHSVREALNIFSKIIEEDPEYLLQKEPKMENKLYPSMCVLFYEIQSAVTKIDNNGDDKSYCESKIAELKQSYPALMENRQLQSPKRYWWNICYYSIYILAPELEQKLNNLECPFKWVKGLTKPQLDNAERGFHHKVKEKLDTSNDSDFLEYGFPSGVRLMYEYIEARKPPHTIKEIIELCEAQLNSVFENKRNHSLIRKAKIAYLHVLQGCKAFFELYFGNMQSLKDVLNDIPDNKTFNHDVQACINGIKAAFLLTYGPYKTTEIGIQCAKRAVELDSTEGWYYFLVGKGLYIHRRAVNKNHAPTEEELEFMEKAKQMDFKYEESVMFLIEMYSEMIEKGQHREKYIDNTVQLCRSIYERTTDWYCLWRCCQGLLRLDIHDIDIDLIQKCLAKANALSPDNKEIHYTGINFSEILLAISKFYEEKNELTNALHYANLAVEHGKGAPRFLSIALMLKHRIDPSVDLTPTFDEYINKPQTGFSKHVAMCLKARYLLCERRHSVREALKIFDKIIEEDPECSLQKEPKRVKKLYRLIRVLFYDIQLTVTKTDNNGDEKIYCEPKIAELKQSYPALMENGPLRSPERNWWNIKI